MATYKIESTYLENPIILETESNDEAFEMFVAYCDYNGVDEDEIEAKHDDEGVYFAQAKEMQQLDNDSDDEECVATFTFERVKKVVVKIDNLN